MTSRSMKLLSRGKGHVETGMTGALWPGGSVLVPQCVAIGHSLPTYQLIVEVQETRFGVAPSTPYTP
jgi:hypothetical protein